MAWPSTFKNIQDGVIARLNLDATADLSATKDAINQAYGQVFVETEASQTSGTKTLTSGTATYDLSTFITGGIVRIKAMFVSSSGVTVPPLKMISLDSILRRRVGTGGAAAATGYSTHYALNGLNGLELWPTPASADVLTIYYAAQPTALSADGDIPALPEPYATRCLTFGACAELADLTGDPEGDDYQAKFDGWIARFRQHLNRRKGGLPGQFEFVPELGWAPHDPSTLTSEG